MHHEGTDQDGLATRLAKQLEGATRQRRSDALPRELCRHFGVDEDDLAVVFPVVSSSKRAIVNRPFEPMLIGVLPDLRVDRRRRLTARQSQFLSRQRSLHARALLHPPLQAQQWLRDCDAELLGPTQHDIKVAVGYTELVAKEVVSGQLLRSEREQLCGHLTRLLLFGLFAVPHWLEGAMDLR